MATIRQYSTTFAPLIGRCLIAAIFLVSGAGKIATPGPTQGYIASVGVQDPLMPYLGAVVIELAGGILLVLGYRVREVALILAAYCIFTALMFHHELGDPNQLFHFLKNIAITGGLLMVFEFGAGAISLDARYAGMSSAVAQVEPSR